MQPGPSNPSWQATAHRSRSRRLWPSRVFQGAVAIGSIAVLLASNTAYTKGQHFIRSTHKISIRVAAGANAGPGAVKKPPPTKFGAMNVLLLGIDSRAGLTPEEVARYHLGTIGLGGSDTIMLVHLSSKRDQATIISFPRDLYVTIPQFATSDGKTLSSVKMKINAAYPRGGVDGPALTVATIEALTGLTIDHYMSIDVPHLGRMVTALGGIDVCLPVAVSDPIRNHQGSGLELPKGKSHLNDVQAVAYVRARHIDTGEGVQDFGRIRRQQKFLSAMLRKVTSLGTLLNVTKLENFLNTVSDAVTMDSELNQKDLFTIAQQLQGLDPKHVTFVTVPIANDNYVVPNVGDTVLADTTASQALYAALREDQPVGAADYKSRPKTLKPSEVAVKVLNGGGQPGAGGKAAAELAAMGFTSGGAPANADRHDYPTTTIHYPGDKISEARTVQLAVPGATLVPDDAVTVVTLILGKSFAGTTPIPGPTSTESPKPVVTHLASDNLCTA